MSIIYPKAGRLMRPMALLLTAILTLPLFAGCGGPKASDTAANNPNSGTLSNTSTNTLPRTKQGLNNKQKVAITLAGAAALYYLYRQHQNKQGTGKNGQYYQSKNGGIYYRDAQGRPVYVKPPSQPIQVQVPASEAQQYSQYSGYNGSSGGRSFGGVTP